jgi:hypothetical protein
MLTQFKSYDKMYKSMRQIKIKNTKEKEYGKRNNQGIGKQSNNCRNIS